MAIKRRVKQDVLPVPSTREEADRLIARLGEIQRETAVLDAALAERVAVARRDAETLAQPLKAEAALIYAAVEAWATAHRSALMTGAARSARLPSGTIGWRTTPPAVRIEQQQHVLALLLAERRYQRFVRNKVEIDRSALLREPDAAEEIPGITIVQRDEFYVEPVGAETAPGAAA